MNRHALLSGLSVVLALPLLGADLPTPPAHVKHVIIVEFENTDASSALKQPAFAALAKHGALLQNFYAEVHPSQPNYIAMVAGDTFGYKTDSNIDIDVRHIGDLLEEAGKTWKTYAENYPGHCFLGAKSGYYARKHVPFLSFKNIQRNPQRCAQIVEAAAFLQDIEQGELPDFALYIPNLRNDGHDTGVKYANGWLQKTFLAGLSHTQLPPNTLVIYTFDESSLFGGNHIYTSFVGDMVKPGSFYTNRIDHYGLLHTIEVLLGVGDLGKKDKGAPVVDGIWKN